MATTKQFNTYNLANSIDATQDLLLIYNNTSGTLQNISRNTYLALSSAPLGLTDTQSPTNKTFNNTTTITIKDGSFTLQNSASVTKQAVFSAASITAGQTRTITIPDASGTLGLLGSSQTWSGANSFTGSSWTGGTISNTAISADTINGFTTSTSGNIYGIAVTSGVITGANTIGSAALQTNAVQANQLATTAISIGYTPFTTTFSTTSATAVQVTGLTVTVTIPAGGRKVKITAFIGQTVTSGSNTDKVSIWDGTVGSGTQLAQTQFTHGSAFTGWHMAVAIVTPSAGSKTYNVGYATDGGTGTITGSTTQPAFVSVEVI